MTTTAHAPDDALAPELEAIAAAADDRLQAQAGQDLSAHEAAQRRVAEAASAAIAAGAALGAIADAERAGELRARRALSTDVLRHVSRAAKRKREADSEYEQAITPAGRLGLSHREIATAAEVSHGTVRAILTRATASLNGNDPEARPGASGHGRQRVVSRGLSLIGAGAVRAR
jgi:DNA-binding NarL/FixJ family response regulator